VSAKARNKKRRSKRATRSRSTRTSGKVGNRWPERPPRRLLTALFLFLAVGAGAAIRIHTTLSDPNFDTADARPLLRSDPGLLHYITERIVENGGLPPDDFGADARIEHPGSSDIPAMFTVGQEFVVAWGYLLWNYVTSDADTPLHVVAVWIMGVFASLAVLGVFGLAFELTGRLRWAVLAGSVYLLLLGNYRTIGFIFIREDFSLPWLALHLYLFARALRVRTRFAILATALTLIFAASTWHAMGFVLAMEAIVLLGWYLRSGENPMAHRDAWMGLAVIALGSLAVPVLRAKGFLVSLPVLVVTCLWVAGQLERSGRMSSARARLAAPILLVALVLVTRLVDGGQGDYSHVVELMTSKVLNAGALPTDPSELSFDARLLWQGPFATATARDMFGFLGAGLALIAIAFVWGCYGWLRQRGDSRLLALLGFAVAGVLSALLVRRMAVLPALLLPVVAACAVHKLRSPSVRALAITLFLAFQGVYFYVGIDGYQCPWYHPPARGVELAEVVRWAEEHIPSDEAIATDYETATAVLAHGRHPILLQPKYETTSSRRRIEAFSDAFVHGSLADYRALLIENNARYTLVNCDFWSRNLYTAGIQISENWSPDPRTPFVNFCNLDASLYKNLPGFRLVFHSAGRSGSGRMRVFELADR